MQSDDERHPGAADPEDNKHEQNDTAVDSQNEAESQPDSQWTFHAEDTSDTGINNELPAIKPVSWSASEYVAHDKTIGWFLGLGATILAVALVVYFITRELVSPVVIAIIGIAFGVFAARQPQVLEFALDEKGLHAGNKLYSYDHFKSFSILEEEATRSILLMPLQRFMPPITVYYDPADENKIIDILGSYLPHEDRQHDLVDRFMRKIRF